MNTATLGRDGPEISRLGIGGWQAGGTGPWGAGPGADDDEAIAAIRLAVESGVTWVDTAASYGLGHSEEVVARALRPWRVGEDVLVFTKCGHPWDPPDRIRTELSPASIRRECEGSLRRLGVERLDLYQFHHADPVTPIEESWATMAELAQQGKVRWGGVSNFDVELLERCEAVRHVDSLQPELSLLRPEARRDVIPWCAENGTGVIVYSPLGGGVLAKPNDPRAMDRLRSVAERLGIGAAALAVAWTLSVPGVTGAICGARSPGQASGWLPAAGVELDAETLGELDALPFALLSEEEEEETQDPGTPAGS